MKLKLFLDEDIGLSHGETLRRLLKKVGLATRADFKNRIEFFVKNRLWGGWFRRQRNVTKM